MDLAVCLSHKNIHLRKINVNTLLVSKLQKLKRAGCSLFKSPMVQLHLFTLSPGTTSWKGVIFWWDNKSTYINFLSLYLHIFCSDTEKSQRTRKTGKPWAFLLPNIVITTLAKITYYNSIQLSTFCECNDQAL